VHAARKPSPIPPNPLLKDKASQCNGKQANDIADRTCEGKRKPNTRANQKLQFAEE
jgi:hypothetical protein